MKPLPKIIIVTGPTASGKSSVAIKLAQLFAGEIINADSRQVYKELHVGVAKPDESECQKVPHHLYDAVSICEEFNAADYVSLADQIIKKIHGRGLIPIIVGGTGLYLRALKHGLFQPPEIPEEVRAQLTLRASTEGLSVLHQELAEVDVEAAARIHVNDEVRIIRALEVYLATGKSISAWQSEHQFKSLRYETLEIGLKWPREALYERINQRVVNMVRRGLEAEATELFKKHPNNAVLEKTIGYVEWLPYLRSESTQEQVVSLIQQNTRQLAKRQTTWFKREPDLLWFELTEEEKIVSIVNGFLK